MKVNDYPQMKLRLPPELKALIDDAAKNNNRTLNAEIVARIEATFSQEAANNFTLEDIRNAIREELQKQPTTPT